MLKKLENRLVRAYKNRHQGKYAQNLKLVFDVQELSESGSQKIKNLYYEFAFDIFRLVGAVDKARAILHKWTTLQESSPRNTALKLVKGAQLEALARHFQRAKELLLEAEKVLSGTEESALRFTIHKELTAIYLETGNILKADFYFGKTEQSKTNSAHDVLCGYYFEGILTREKYPPQLERSKELFLDTLNQSELRNYPELMWKVHYELGKTFEQGGQDQIAHEHYQHMNTIIHTLSDALPQEYTATYLQRFDVLKARERLYNVENPQQPRDFPHFGEDDLLSTSSLLDRSQLHEFVSDASDSGSKNIKVIIELLEIVGSSQLDIEQLVRGFLTKMIEVSEAERGILLLTEPKENLRIQLALDSSGKKLKSVNRFSWSLPQEAAQKRVAVCVKRTFTERNEKEATTDSMAAYNIRSVLCIPLVTERGVLGVLYLDSRAQIKEYHTRDLDYFNALASHLALHLENAQLWTEKQLLEEARRRELEQELIRFQKNLAAQNIIIAESPAMTTLLDQVRQIAKTDAAVLILGETGTGKESIAHLIHGLSPRREQPHVIIDCSTIPENLMESELFGHEKGAFTGAQAKKIGKFELAQGGTVFLDEIGDLPLALQGKLLRVLEQKEIERVGGVTRIKTDIRIVAATNRNLDEMVAVGQFRSDLYFRLNVIKLYVPPLRERGVDIMKLALFFRQSFCSEYRKKIGDFNRRTIEKLNSYDWPGNVRELKHRVQRAVILSKGSTIDLVDLDLEPPENAQIDNTTWKDELEPHLLGIIQVKVEGKLPGSLWEAVVEPLEYQLYQNCVAKSEGNISRAAWLLGVEQREISRTLIAGKTTHFDRTVKDYIESIQAIFLELIADRDRFAKDKVNHENVVDYLQREFILQVYEQVNGDKVKARTILGLSETTFRRRIQELCTKK